MSKVKQIVEMVDEYELALAKSGLMKFDRVQTNSAVAKDFLYSNEDAINKIINSGMSASEALYGFCGWLTCRDEQTIMSSKDDAAVIAELVDKFCKTNNLSEPKDGWEKELIHPR